MSAFHKNSRLINNSKRIMSFINVLKRILPAETIQKGFMIEEKSCLDCNEIIHGRADKKFCNDQCRNNYNNQRNIDTPLIRNTNTILRKNRRILEELNPAGKTKVSRKKLLNKGFHFDYVTRLYRTQTNTTYHFCYEYGYLTLNNDEVLLVKKVDDFGK